MTVDRKISFRLDQQVSLWMKKQEELYQNERRLERIPVKMEYVIGKTGEGKP